MSDFELSAEAEDGRDAETQQVVRERYAQIATRSEGDEDELLSMGK